jgi:hypothetical protein
MASASTPEVGTMLVGLRATAGKGRTNQSSTGVNAHRAEAWIHTKSSNQTRSVPQLPKAGARDFEYRGIKHLLLPFQVQEIHLIERPSREQCFNRLGLGFKSVVFDRARSNDAIRTDRAVRYKYYIEGQPRKT